MTSWDRSGQVGIRLGLASSVFGGRVPRGSKYRGSNPEWRREFEETLPDLGEEDIGGSGFAITGYTVHPSLGGDAALARLRSASRDRGLRLMLDFVPNHTGIDHPWVDDHCEY